MNLIAFIFILLLMSCQPQSSWEVSHLQTGEEIFNSSRLSYPPSDIVNGIGVEIVRTQNQIKTHLEVHAQTIPAYQGNTNQALVTLKIPGKTFAAVAYRHQGGQRLTLSPELHTFLVEALQNDHPVTILLEGYFTTVDPAEFSSSFEELQTSPLRNPFKLPFKL